MTLVDLNKNICIVFFVLHMCKNKKSLSKAVRMSAILSNPAEEKFIDSYGLNKILKK